MEKQSEWVKAIEELVTERNACMSPEMARVAQFFPGLDAAPPVVQRVIRSWGKPFEPGAAIVCMGESDAGATATNAPPGLLEFSQACNQCEANCLLADVALRSVVPDVLTAVWGRPLDLTLNPLVYNCFKGGLEPLLAYASQDPMPCKDPYGGHVVLVAYFPDGTKVVIDPSVRQLACTFEEATGPMVKVETLKKAPVGELHAIAPRAEEMAKTMTETMQLTPENVPRMKDLYRRIGWDPSLVRPSRYSPEDIRYSALRGKALIECLIKK